MIKQVIGGYLPRFLDKEGHIIENSISKIEKINLGGVDQWITVRGKHKDLPLLLFLHGGPGSPQTGAQRKYLAELEEKFVVVNWDQRGSGKSYSSRVSPESMNVNQIVADAYELSQYLLAQFYKRKLYIMGQSVGAAYGLLFVHRYPEIVNAYIGINQPIHREEEEKRSYEYAYEMAKRKGNRKAQRELKKIGPPSNGVYQKIEDMVLQRKWLTKFNGVTYKMNAALVNLSYIMSTHLTLKEKVSFMKGFGFSSKNLWDEITALNFFELVPEVKVPVFLIAGQHDRIVFPELIEEYYLFLKAEYKQLVIFEESGHYACFEEKEKFIDLLINKVLPIGFEGQVENVDYVVNG
ncbi:alpha/beta fold hydrolase [Fredinandcohnia sp. 179-A 10B2 NHS]|uniref:alpha/beta fold hydrolase n=1 Tax=Fredinandcohnia sp. 179-A 10B2 NHS TaxID=3235176 RepID=UPI0039A0988D